MKYHRSIADFKLAFSGRPQTILLLYYDVRMFELRTGFNIQYFSEVHGLIHVINKTYTLKK